MEAVTLRKDAITETYNDVKNLIDAVVWRFQKRYGGEFEEWRAEANLSFLQAYKTYKKNKSAFSTWLYIIVWRDLLNYHGLIYKLQIHGIVKVPTCNDHPKGMRTRFFSHLEFLDELQEDSKTLAHLIWNPPMGIKLKEIKNGPHPCHDKVVIRNYLFSLGWTGRRIKESFEEIARVLNV